MQNEDGGRLRSVAYKRFFQSLSKLAAALVIYQNLLLELAPGSGAVLVVSAHQLMDGLIQLLSVLRGYTDAGCGENFIHVAEVARHAEPPYNYVNNWWLNMPAHRLRNRAELSHQPRKIR
jgi:hypothetical protein